MKTYIVYTWNKNRTAVALADEIEAKSMTGALIKYLFNYFHLGATVLNSYVWGLKTPIQD